jgi:hypothetical protein
MPSMDAIGSGFGARFGLGLGIGARLLKVSACLVLAAATSSNAQNRDESSSQSYVVTRGDGVQLRCGQGAGFYPTQEIAAGQVLLVTEQAGQWLRVQYPAGSEAYVSADAVSVSGDVATLISERSLRHMNPRTGKRGSWKPLYDAPLARGTRLEVVAFEDSPQAQHKAYRVVAPAGAQAYIEASAVRQATADEVTLYLTATGTNGRLNAAGDLIRPNVKSVGSGEIATIDSSEPAERGNHEFTPPELAPQTAEIRSGTPSQLEATFQAVRAQPSEEAEYGELIGEYRRALDSLDERPANEPLRVAYQQRLDFLLMQQRFQEAKRAASKSLSDLEENSKTVAKALNELDKTRRYVVIGRLTTSVVYDGERLPLMYRIQSVGDRVPRTLGYIKPTKAFGLSGKIGRIVGIEGKTLLDKSLKLNVVTPMRVDVLTPSADGSLTREEQTKPQAPGETPAPEPKKTTGG